MKNYWIDKNESLSKKEKQRVLIYLDKVAADVGFMIKSGNVEDGCDKMDRVLDELLKNDIIKCYLTEAIANGFNVVMQFVGERDLIGFEVSFK